MLKIERLHTIKNIIKNDRIRSQEQLLERLSEAGYPVTQGTLSRDLKFLKVGKVPDAGGGFYYKLPATEQIKETKEGFLQDIARGCISIDFSGNLSVLHTMPGHANSVAFALDNLEIHEVLGTIAGDDTVLIILREEIKRSTLVETLQGIAPEIEVPEAEVRE